MTNTGVLPVYTNSFAFGKNGRASADPADFVPVADMETFSISIDNGVEEWTPMDQEGWTRRLTTKKSLTFSIKGKRNIGDAGNDYIAGLLLKTGQDCNTTMIWTMPSGASLTVPCVVQPKTAGGDSTAVDALEFDVLSDGKPTYKAAV